MAQSQIALRVAASLACAATFYLTACSDTAITPSPRSVSSGGASETQNPDLFDANGRHVFHTKPWHENDNAANGGAHGRGGGGGGSTTGISYHGGPVLQSHTNVVAIYWASGTIFNGGPTPGDAGAGSADGSLVGYFLNHLGGSPYFNINTTYTDGSGQAILNIVNYTNYWANNVQAPSGTQSVSDAQMLSMIQSGIAGGKIPYDGSTLYAIFTSGAVNLGGGFGTQYCAYHSSGTITVSGRGQTVRYAAMPYNYAYPSACTNGTAPANGDPGADYEVNTLGHETEETTTDEFGSAWFDSRGFENADKCAWNFGSTFIGSGGGVANVTIGSKDFLVQQNWVNAGTGGCLQHWP
jgi:hypothetical protein